MYMQDLFSEMLLEATKNFTPSQLAKTFYFYFYFVISIVGARVFLRPLFYFAIN